MGLFSANGGKLATGPHFRRERGSFTKTSFSGIIINSLAGDGGQAARCWACGIYFQWNNQLEIIPVGAGGVIGELELPFPK